MSVQDSKNNLPRFLGIGAQKSGTTWLHSALIQHPELCLPVQKETYFFETSSNFSKGLDWYTDQFSPSSEDQIRGEINPGYLWVAPPPKDTKIEFNMDRNAVPHRVAQTLGTDIKLIVMLRNPIDRAISAYVHHVSKGRVDPAGDRISAFRRMGISHIGFYHSHIAHWLSFFPRQNFRFYCYESIRNKKNEFYRSVFDFLGVSPLSNLSADKRMQQFAQYTRDENGVHIVEKVSKKSPLEPGMKLVTTDEIAYLRELYKRDVQQLRNLLGSEEFNWDHDFPISA